MAKKQDKSTSTVLAAHSKAKVQLLKLYLSTYLNIMQRASQISKVYLFDLCAGEGVYTDGGKGSPIIMLETIKNHYYSNNNSCPDIEIIFNDSGRSEIEPHRLKIERVEEASNKIFRPDNVVVYYDSKDYREILSDVKKKLSKIKGDERTIVFIDPWGYKDIHVADVLGLLANNRTEVLLFLPTRDMHRFADKSLSDQDFSGGKPLRKFLKSLFKNDSPNVSSNLAFTDSILRKFKSLEEVKFGDKFTIEREKGQYFCLYFFTSHRLGLRKMLEAKWKLDESHGRGFKLDSSQGDLFTDVQYSDYPDLLKSKLNESLAMTNRELELFGTETGYLPKHTNQILNQWKKLGIIEITSLDGLPVKGFYLDDNKRTIQVKLK